MNDKCKWVESQLEAYFSETMASNARAELERHSASCATCGAELDAFAKVDELVAAHFRQQLRIADRRSPRGAQPIRLAGAIATAAGVFLAVWIGVGALGPAPEVPASGTAASSEGGGEVKADETPDAERAKPDPAPQPSTATPDRQAPSIGEAMADAPAARFYVQDAAGYFHTLEDFQGSALVLGVMANDADHIAAFERAYERYGAEGLRFLGVPADDSPAFTVRFPTMTNRNSTLLETGAGEFAILAPDGSVYARGSLDGAELAEAIEGGIRELTDR
jgi:hypothetical protein